MPVKSLFRRHEPVFCAQNRALKERALTCGALLIGTPGTLIQRTGTGYAYWYRVFYPVPGIQAETLVGRADDRTAEMSMRQHMNFAEWMSRQVTSLRKGGFAVADKRTARLLVELHNLGVFAAGLVVLGNLAGMAWLNELGVALRKDRKASLTSTTIPLGAPRSFLDTPVAATLPFCRMEHASATRIDLAGLSELRVDLGVPGENPDEAVPVTRCNWSARRALHYDYLLESPESGAILAGGHCIPVLLPQAARLVWHTLFASTTSVSPEQAAGSRRLALGLAAALIENDPWALLTAWEKAPASLTAPIRQLREAALSEVSVHPELCDLLDDCLR